jgi:anti-sigma B factor antagonist
MMSWASRVGNEARDGIWGGDLGVNLGDFHSTYLRVRPRGDILVVEFTTARLSEDVNIEQIGHDLSALVDQYGARRLVVTLRGITYLTSSALGKLITLHRKMHRAEGRVVYAELEPTVLEIVTASKLDTYLQVTTTLDEACSLLGG